MKYIANIISKSSVKVGEFFNVVKTIDKIDPSLPTMIVGWSLVKELFPEQDILEEVITPNMAWTFSKREKRYKYEKDMENFISDVLKKLDDSVNYTFFNYMLSPSDKRASFHRYMDQGGNYIYRNSRFVYVYNPQHNITFGISLNDIKYIGISIDTFISSLNRMSNNHIVEDISFLDEFSLRFIKDNVKAVAYLYYLKFSDIYEEKNKYGQFLQQNA